MEDTSSERLDKDRRRKQILESFRNDPFEEIVARSEAKVFVFYIFIFLNQLQTVFWVILFTFLFLLFFF